jgi:hypothetical protein
MIKCFALLTNDGIRMLEINLKTQSEIENRYYFNPIKEGLEAKAAEAGDAKVLSYLTEVMQTATPQVEKLIQARIRDKIYFKR